MSRLPIELQDILLMIPWRAFAALVMLATVVTAALLATDAGSLATTIVMGALTATVAVVLVTGALGSERASEIRARPRHRSERH